MSQSKDGLDRRALLGLGAAGAALGGLAAAGAAQADDPQIAHRGLAARGPGIPTPTPLVKAPCGPVQGLVIDGVCHFKGIRYGLAPIGSRRWKAPEPVPAWTSRYDASDFGAPAMQMAAGAVSEADNDFSFQMHQVFTTPSEMKVMNEDCLFLNVWTPAPDARKRPVMVWIHGGGFAYGSGAQPIYQGDGLAKAQDVVAVSVNHRLNLFGYLYLGEAFGPDFAGSGSVGMQDLVLALKWVRDNISAFGGDPDNVTIMGQSGGGAKVSILLAMESAKGLFHKAAIESGPGLKVGRKATAAAYTDKLLAALKIDKGDVKALQAVPAETLLAAAAGLSGGGFGPGPILDDVAITRDPFSPDAPSISRDVPILVGWCKDEWTIFTAGEPWFGKMTEADLQARIKPFGPPGQKLLTAIRAAYPTYSPTYLFVELLSARMMLGSEVLADAKAAQGGAPVYVYRMDWETPVSDGVFKSPHTMEIPFVLYSYDKVRTFVGEGPGPAHMAAQIGGAWAAFARTGRPDHPALPAWPAYTPARRPVMIFNTVSRVEDDPLPELRKTLEAMPQILSFGG
ncbi:MAG: carboxylesterase/lipase family protein [Alphaproteobacteria bacterium]|nr:carboxylesterase/lipase family protein [Alphaproteobacteria bacterium]